MKSQIIAQGAEAIITLVTPHPEKSPPLTKSPRSALTESSAEQSIASNSEPIIIKDRIPKTYRLKELDEQIRRRRTKAETKLLDKASKIINCPAPIIEPNGRVGDSMLSGTQIQMLFIKGQKLSDHLDSFPLAKQKQVCRKIGESIAKLHSQNIIHGDLTTSNMILVKNEKSNFEKQLAKIKKLKLPPGKYAIAGSGPLCIRGIRDGHDIDLIVTKDLFEEYRKKKGWKLVNFFGVNFLQNNYLELWDKIGFKEKTILQLIKDAENIRGFPVVNLNDFIRIKEEWYREKDKQDVRLAKKYLALIKSQQNALTKSGTEPSTSERNEPIIYFIDFGLGFVSHKYEDKAVDLHLLKQALEAKHFKHWEELFNEVVKGYLSKRAVAGEVTDRKIVLERLKAVEKRGRYKH